MVGSRRSKRSTPTWGKYTTPVFIVPLSGTNQGANVLVLTRKLGENIRIGDDIKITVLEVRSGQVKLGFDAPPDKKIQREEIYQRIQEENRRAASGHSPPTSGPSSS